jgi:hypothetical protein
VILFVLYRQVLIYPFFCSLLYYAFSVTSLHSVDDRMTNEWWWWWWWWIDEDRYKTSFTYLGQYITVSFSTTIFISPFWMTWKKYFTYKALKSVNQLQYPCPVSRCFHTRSFIIISITNYMAQEHEGSSPHSQQLATGPYPEPVECNPPPCQST